MDIYKRNKKIILISAFTSLLASSFVLLVVAVAFLAIYGKGPIFSSQLFNGNYERSLVLSHEATIVSVGKSAQPAVVSIIVSRDVPVVEEFGFFDPFDGVFEFRMPQFRERGTERREVSGGTGFVVSPDGMVVTNRHVVESNEAFYSVVTSDGDKYEVEVVAKDPVIDIAILKIKDSKKNFEHLSFADSDRIEVGQTAIAIGNALGEFKNTLSVGVISGLSRSIVARDTFGRRELLDEVIQTDAAINFGNSGGPLLNVHGEVVGVNVAMAAGSENIGFAIPSNVVKSIVDSVEKHGKILRPFLGIRYIPVTAQLKEERDLPFEHGILIIRGESEPAVVPDSPAEKADLRENDIILEMDGVRIEGMNFATLIRGKQAGETVDLKVWRNGRTFIIPATLTEIE